MTSFERHYVWDGAHIIAEYENGSLTKKYIYGPGIDNPIVMIDVSGASETWFYYYKDVLGSIRLITDASGTMVLSYTYDPFGHPRVMLDAGNDGNWLTEDTFTLSFCPLGNPIMFTGRWWDSETQLYYYRFRDYSPILGRFLQPDPAKYIDGMNLYAYCGNNPVNWVDPWGLLPTEEHNRIHEGDGDLDSGWTHPWNPFSTWLHFRDRDDVEKELREAVRNQDRSNWNGLKHQGEDTFSHKPGIGGVLDHMLNPNLDQQAMDNGAAGPDGRAEQWSDDWEGLYDLNPDLDDLADAADEWVGKTS